VSIALFKRPTADLELLVGLRRLLATHWAIDAHLSLPLLDKFLEFFVAEVEGKAPEVDELKWGDETKRLPPALIEAVAEPYRAEMRPLETDQSTAPLPVRFALAHYKHVY
jgi:hypothetical protein